MIQDRTLINFDFTDKMLWSRIVSEARAVSTQDDFLAPILSASIMEKESLTDAIAGRLSDLLFAPHSAASLLSALRSLSSSNPDILAGAGFDIAAVLERDPATAKALHVLLHGKGFLAIQTHRFAHTLWNLGRREFALHLKACGSRVFQVDIHPAAKLGVGLFFDHATGIVVGETSVIEDDVSILQNVTLGGTGKETGERHPKIRSGVLLGAGALVLGNIEVGANARVGAGSVVLKPVKPRSTVAGVPARMVREDQSYEPSRTMDQVFEGSGPSYDVGL